MSYKKPQIVAKSAAKQSYVAGCPPKEWNRVYSDHNCRKCELSGN